jgi:putative lipase involved disintegration of autophagic bodies
MELKEKYISHENIFLLDPIYDQHILNRIRSNCYLYIHGHSAGGTNPSLVEAIYLGLPILAFGVEYNKETTKK